MARLSAILNGIDAETMLRPNRWRYCGSTCSLHRGYPVTAVPPRMIHLAGQAIRGAASVTGIHTRPLDSRQWASAVYRVPLGCPFVSVDGGLEALGGQVGVLAVAAEARPEASPGL